VVFCCRPVDFCALTAALSLLLAHLDSHQNSIGVIFTQQRIEDRGLVERALVTLDELNKMNNDELSRQTAQVVRKLLHAESDAAAGGNIYTASSSASESDAASHATPSRPSFTVKIPYYRAVSVAREASEPFQGNMNDLHGFTGTATSSGGILNTTSTNLTSSTTLSSQPSSDMGSTASLLFPFSPVNTGSPNPGHVTRLEEVVDTRAFGGWQSVAISGS